MFVSINYEKILDFLKNFHYYWIELDFFLIIQIMHCIIRQPRILLHAQ